MKPDRFPSSLLHRAARVRLVVFDVDGVLTDGRIFYASDGSELKAFNTKDGASCKLLAAQGYHLAIITGRDSPMVSRRAGELGIRHVHQGIEHKPDALREVCRALDIEPEQTAHVGDDFADMPLFDEVGLAIAPSDAHPVVAARAHFVTPSSGGGGVAADVAELLMRSSGKWPYD